MRLSVLGVLASLWVCVLAAPSDPKVKPLLAADAEEAAAAKVEEPRDKRNWIHVNQDGFVDAFVESDVDPAFVATSIAAASSAQPSFVPPSPVSGRTRSPGFNQFNQFHQFGYYNQFPSSAYNPYYGTQGRTGSSSVPFQQLVQYHRNWPSWRDYSRFNEWRRSQGLQPVHFNNFNRFNSFGFNQPLPDVIDTSPQGRTRIEASPSGQHVSVYAPADNFYNQGYYQF